MIRFFFISAPSFIFSCSVTPEKQSPVHSDLDSGQQPSFVPDHNDPEAEEDGHVADGVEYAPGVQTQTILSNSGRILTIDVWYPTESATGDLRTYGWPDFEFAGSALENAPVACSTPRPVIVHSHGNASIRWEFFPLHEYLASHGYLVVAPDHLGNTIYNNTFLTALLTVQRPQDIRDVYDWVLLESSLPESPFHGCVDPDSGYVVSGYSFGGYTAYVTAGGLVNDAWGQPSIDLSDSRVAAAMVYAPWTVFILNEGIANVSVPVLSIGADQDMTVGDDPTILFNQVTSAPRAIGQFPTGGHFTFTPMYCSFLAATDGCGVDNVDPDDAMPLIQYGTLAFLQSLNGGHGGLDALSSTDIFQWTYYVQ